MSEFDYDAIVIGSGPAGEGAAMKLAKIGKDVAVVERYARVGGGCTHWGTIPSKALRHAIQMAGELRQNTVFKKLTNGGLNQRVDVPDLLSTARSVIERQVVMR
ncbi:MAG: FAD-dependent oxidoreductase, partial [Desulfobacterales bacterium]|nr:FAD-dependent oxidoreductase [Desulfobacterales bacterium]